MTENEAKTKWCCGPKIISDQMLADRLIPAKVPNPPESNGLCCGSKCMAWRWAAFAEGEEHAGNIHGYCGLAGK